MLAKSVAIVVVLALSTVTFSSEQSVLRERNLKRGTVVVLKAVPVPTYKQSKSAGGSGSLFMFLPQESDNEMLVRYISFDGQTVYTYKPSTIQTKKKLEPIVLDMTSDGHDVFLLIPETGKEGVPINRCHAPRFTLDGKFRNDVELDYDFYSCNHIAHMGAGQLLVAGLERVKNNTDNTDDVYGYDDSPIVLIFSESGQLLRKLDLRNDVRPWREPDPLRDTAAKPRRENDVPVLKVETVELGSIVDRDAEGNVWIVRTPMLGEKSTEALLRPFAFFIRPSGEVKRVPLKAPENGDLIGARISHGRIAALYLEQSDYSVMAHGVLRVFTLDGKQTLEYKYDLTGVGVMLVDWTPSRVLFGTQVRTRNPDKKFVFVEASPE